jgi:hypothetical protein
LLEAICNAKLFDKKSALTEAADKIELTNIVLEVVPELDVTNPDQQARSFTEQLLSAIYYGQMLPHTSLFFYRCAHLERVLSSLALHPKYSKERDFWLKSEDMILRQRE